MSESTRRARASAQRRCPVCDRDKSCNWIVDELYFCIGWEGEPPAGFVDVKKGVADGNGFRHFKRDDGRHAAPAQSRTSSSATMKPKPKPAATVKTFSASEKGRRLTPKQCEVLAASLGLPVEATIVVPFCWDGEAYTHQEFDGREKSSGITRRFPDGRKSQVTGSRRGLVLFDGWRDRAGPLCVTEGMSDGLAAYHAGLNCVARANALHGADQLAELLKDWPDDVPVIIIGDNDKAGVDGAKKVAGELAAAMSRPIRVGFPPDGVNDIRAYLTGDHWKETTWPERGDQLRRHLEATAVMVKPPAPDDRTRKDADEDDGDDGDGKKLSAADVLVGIGLNCELWKDHAGRAYASLGRLSMAIRSDTFRPWLIHQYRLATGKVPNGEATGNALTVIEATAQIDGPAHEANARFATHAGRLYLHLADDANTVYEIDAEGWRTCDNPPVKFRRPMSMRPLPHPTPGGRLDRLRELLNLEDDAQYALLLAWLCAAVRPVGSRPILVLTGEQGSAKTTFSRLLKRLIDPTAAEVRCEPRDVQALMIQAGNSGVLAFDNISDLPKWFSDDLCRMSTGGGTVTRKLYTDGDEQVFDVRRPVVLNGIEDFVTRSDLLERSLLFRLPPIPDTKRVSESAFWDAFDAIHPQILGALLDRVVRGLRVLPQVRLPALPRMADFATFAVACETAAGEPPLVLAAYAQNQADGHEQALDDDPVAAALTAALCDANQWEGTATELLRKLSGHVPDPKPRDWPRAPNALSGRLRRLAPDLRSIHGLTVRINVRDPGGADGKRTRKVCITRRPKDAAK